VLASALSWALLVGALLGSDRRDPLIG